MVATIRVGLTTLERVAKSRGAAHFQSIRILVAAIGPDIRVTMWVGGVCGHREREHYRGYDRPVGHSNGQATHGRFRIAPECHMLASQDIDYGLRVLMTGARF